MSTVELRTRVGGGCAVVVLHGEMDVTDTDPVADAVAALAVGGQHLIIDLEALEFMDCHATGALLRARKIARRAGGDLLLAAPHGPVLRLLTVLGVPGVYVSVESAAEGASRRAARLARSWRAIPSSGRNPMRARGPGVPGPRAGGRARPLRWLRGFRGLRG